MNKKDLVRLANLEAEATPAPWEWWTSNSWRRLSHKGDGDVLCPCTQRSDGHPDVICSEEDKALIVEMRNKLPALLMYVKELEGRLEQG